MVISLGLYIWLVFLCNFASTDELEITNSNLDFLRLLRFPLSC